MYYIVRSVYIMKEYERLIAPSLIELEVGVEKTFTVKVVNTLNELLKEDLGVELKVISDQGETVLELAPTYDQKTHRYLVIIPGLEEVRDYDLKWSYKVRGHYTYVF